MKTTKNYLLTVFIAVLMFCIFTACSNTASGKSTRSTGDESPTPVAGTYVKVPYSDLDTYLANLSGTGPHYIEVTGPILTKDFKGNNGFDKQPGALGQKLKNHLDKKVALKIENYPEDLTDMTSCFYGCAGLTTAPNIPESVTNMGSCFDGCTSLTMVPNIPEGVTGMESCFSGCKSLTTAPNIPASVTKMDSCFYLCTSLQTVTLKCGYKDDSFGAAFAKCSGLVEGGIKVPQDQLEAYKGGAENMGTTEGKFAAN